MKSLGRLLLLGAALALLAPTSSWANHTDTGSRHGLRRPDRTHHRADHRRTRPRRHPSLSLGYSHYGGVTVRFGYGYRYGHSDSYRDGHHYQRRANYRHDRYYRRHHRRHDYARHYYDDHYHRGHH